MICSWLANCEMIFHGVYKSRKQGRERGLDLDRDGLDIDPEEGGLMEAMHSLVEKIQETLGVYGTRIWKMEKQDLR